MKTPIRLLAFLAALSAAPLIAQVQVPSLMNYQGQLANAAGAPLPTADYTLTFRIYDAAQGGALIWGPQIFDGTPGPGHGPKIPVVQGYFNVMLGPSDAAASPRPLSDAFVGSAARYLEIQIAANTPLSPRQQLLSSPFAFAAGASARADKLKAGDGGNYDWSAIFGSQSPATGTIPLARINVPNGSLPASAISANNGITAGQLAPGSVTTVAIGPGAVTKANLSPALQLDSIIPPGSVMPYAGTVEPAGWKFCDGSSRLRTDPVYARLFDAIGTAHGAADGTHFNLPDYQGRFLRGVDGVNNRDPDRNARTSMNPGGNSGSAIGSVQLDAFQTHGHSYTDPGHTHGNVNPGNFLSAAGGVYGIPGSGRPAGLSTSRDTTDITINGPNSGRSSSETRPVNASVNYIIKL